MNIHIIEKNNIPEFVILPYEKYKKISHYIEELNDNELTDEELYLKAKRKDDGTEIPAKIAFDICDGKHPIKAYREYNRLTQEQLAKKSGFSKQYISNVERGISKGSIKFLKKIANVFKVDLDELIKD